MNRLVFKTLAILNLSEGMIHLVTAGVSFWGMYSIGICDWRVATCPATDLALGLVSLVTGAALGTCDAGRIARGSSRDGIQPVVSAVSGG